MTFDKWFEKQDRIVKIILLIIPFVGWVVEILVRISAVLRNASTTNILGLILFILLGGFWIPTLIDLIYFIVADKFLFYE
ncbi:MAG: hypothetical protein J6M95_04575 [Bacilli bacterium]|nr:hypothetical protein [Bacilli bacterium]